MRKLTFEVSVEFTDNIKDFELEEVIKNLSDGIFDLINRGEGLSPQESIACTKSFRVKETLSGISHKVDIF
jgi:hypothetical protein